MNNLHRYLLMLGIALILYGYWLLAVPPDALYEQVLARVKGGIFSVLGGSGILIAWLTKR
ncbi:MAG: hypothetical protein WBI04_03685 [Trichlorobacter sp.]|jgi:hypothetical protein